jgi:hypothetical protein
MRHAVRPAVSAERRGCSGEDGGRHAATARVLEELLAEPDIVGELRRRDVGRKWWRREFHFRSDYRILCSVEMFQGHIPPLFPTLPVWIAAVVINRQTRVPYRRVLYRSEPR